MQPRRDASPPRPALDAAVRQNQTKTQATRGQALGGRPVLQGIGCSLGCFEPGGFAGGPRVLAALTPRLALSETAPAKSRPLSLTPLSLNEGNKLPRKSCPARQRRAWPSIVPARPLPNPIYSMVLAPLLVRVRLDRRPLLASKPAMGGGGLSSHVANERP